MNMSNPNSLKKLDKSLLPQPQKPLGWKKNLLRITTADSNPNLTPQLPQQQQPSQPDFPPTTKNSHINRQSITSNRQRQNSMTPSQYSLEQKELLTFGVEEQGEEGYNEEGVEGDYGERKGRFFGGDEGSSQLQGSRKTYNNQSPSSIPSVPPLVTRTPSKDKPHKTTIYTHPLLQPQEFLCYSIVTKDSSSGMFTNPKLLLLNSHTRQLMYYSRLPKLLPFGSYQQMHRQYLGGEKPKEVIELDRVRRFLFVPAKGSLAGVVVSFVDERGERREWRLGMGSNGVMGEWIEVVNEVLKKEHYQEVKKQVKYPPRPKKQPQNKPNNYQTKFTKTLKQQVLPMIRQTLRTSQLNQSSISSPPATPSKSAALSKSRQKQYAIDKSKFLNTKSYVIDLEDAKIEDVFYEPEVEVGDRQRKIEDQQGGNGQQKGYSEKDESQFDSRFSQHLQQRQQQIATQHRNRVSRTITTQQPYHQQHPTTTTPSYPLPPSTLISRKPSTQRMSQTTHKDLNIHIDSQEALRQVNYDSFQEGQGYSYSDNRMDRVSMSQVYYEGNSDRDDNRKQKNGMGTPSMAERLMQAARRYDDNDERDQQQDYEQREDEYARKRGYTEMVLPNSRTSQANTPAKPTTNNLVFNSNHHNQSQHFSSISKNDNRNANRDLPQPPPNRHSHYSQLSTPPLYSQHPSIYPLHPSPILNFSPLSPTTNNWFRLWLQTQPHNRTHIYSSFVKTCQLLVTQLIDTPQTFTTTCPFTLSPNNTHITFTKSNITLKLPFKLPLPQGLGEFISIVGFIKSQDFLSQVWRHRKEIEDQYRNYAFLLGQLREEWAEGVAGMPLCVPMCCLVRYKGVTVMCKADWQAARYQCEKVPEEEFTRYATELQYVEQTCHVKFPLPSASFTPSSFTTPAPFTLHLLTLPSFTPSTHLLYIDNLTHFLPLLPNPLHHNPTPSLQLNPAYIKENIKKGVIRTGRDLEEVEKHVKGTGVKRVVDRLGRGDGMLGGGGGWVDGVIGEEYLGVVYSKVEEMGVVGNSAKWAHVRSLLLTELVLAEYLKACQLYLMKEYLQHLTQSISPSFSSSPSYHPNFSSKTINPPLAYQPPTPKSPPFSQTFTPTVIEMLHYLLYRNSKVWTVIVVALEEKYGVGGFAEASNGQRHAVEVLVGKVCVEGLVRGLMERLGVEAGVEAWSASTTWSTFPVDEDHLSILPYPQVTCYPLSVFLPQYQTLLQSLQSSNSSHTPSAPSSSLYSFLLQTLSLSEQSFNNQLHIIKSPAYELLQMGYRQEKGLVDRCLSYFIPVYAESGQQAFEEVKVHHKVRKDPTKAKRVQLYSKLITQSQVRTTRDVSPCTFSTHLNGIKWLIKQHNYQLAQVLLQQQLQAITIWYTPFLLQTRLRYLDLASTFHHTKLANCDNRAISYVLQSLNLCLQNKPLLPLATCAEKSFHAANVHFECHLLEKSLQLYELTEELVYQAEKNKKIGDTGLEVGFLVVYVKKAGIRLAMGDTKGCLGECVEGLRKCEEFQGVIEQEEKRDRVEDQQQLNDPQQYYPDLQKDHQTLQDLQLSIFELMFRCYQVTKNYTDMERITKLCCNKFVEDRVLVMRMATSGYTQRGVRANVMERVLKMCWVVVVNGLGGQQREEDVSMYRSSTKSQYDNNEHTAIMSTLTNKSFCLSGYLSHSRDHNRSTKIPPQPNPHLESLKQKLLALCHLYPKTRYDPQTLTMFVCQQVIEANLRMIKRTNDTNVRRDEYRLVRGSGFGRRVGRGEERERGMEGDGQSVMFERLREVVGELVGNGDMKGQQGRSEKNNNNNRIGRFNTQANFNQNTPQPQRRSISRQHQGYQTTTQPHLSRPSITPSSFSPSPSTITTYNIYSLKDSMDRKYMLMEALFGLCGRGFVVGWVDGQVRGGEGYQ